MTEKETTGMIPAIIISNILVLILLCVVSHIEGSLLIKYKAKANNKPTGVFDFVTMRYLERYASERKRLTGRFKLVRKLNMIGMIIAAILLLLLLILVVFRINADLLLDKVHWSILLSPALFGALAAFYVTTMDKSNVNTNHTKVILGLFAFDVIVVLIVTLIQLSCRGS